MEKTIIISLGGSLIVPDSINVEFLKGFIDLIKNQTKQGFKFVIITGGGKVCRKYNDAVKEIITPHNDDLDLIGIATTRLNAEFIRVLFGDLAHDKIILDPDFVPEFDKSIILGGGWKPGNSSDLAAVHIAKSINSKLILNLSNIDYVYDKDPKKFPDAVKIEQSNWSDFRKLLPNEWDPGLNAPFDPIAAKVAEELGIEVAIMNGNNLDNLKNYLNGSDFIGTKIK